jgi:hypothetical protein
VGQKFESLGANKPCYNSFGAINFHLKRQFWSYSKWDDPLSHVKPVPVQALLHALDLAHAHGHVESLAVAHMICIGFYFLMQPGKHTAPSGNSKPFPLVDVEFMIGHHQYSGLTIPINLIHLVTFTLLIFTDQKNGVRGKKIGHGQSGHPRFCAVKALCHRVWHLR